MPTVASSCGWETASVMQTTLEGADVATAIIVSTPAARARSRTAGRSAANCSASRGACVSMRGAMSSHARERGRWRGGQRFQLWQVPAFERQQLFNLGMRGRIFQRGQVTLQDGDRLTLAVEQTRQDIIEGQKVDRRETGRKGRQK